MRLANGGLAYILTHFSLCKLKFTYAPDNGNFCAVGGWVITHLCGTRPDAKTGVFLFYVKLREHRKRTMVQQTQIVSLDMTITI